MKFSLEWLSDSVDIGAAGGAAGVRRLLDRAGLPAESAVSVGEDTVFDVEITPNRPDAMSHRGLAREVAAMVGLPLQVPPSIELRASRPTAEELTSVTIEVPRLCRRFGARLIRGIGDSPAPDRVRSRLASIGSKPISAAVDATNYVLWDLGQPLHAFDWDRLRGGRLIVRKARKEERLITLDGEERMLQSSDIVVADAERAVSLAGIMGGLETAVTPQTRNVLLEAAWWDPVAIRKTARRLGIHSDASHRFERGADPEAIPEALDRAAGILLEAAGGTLATGLIDARGQVAKTRRALLRLSRLRLLAGDDRLDIDFAAVALARLGFVVERRGQRLSVGVPSWRPDVSMEDDLVEEVLRVYGYDRLPSRLPPTRGGGGHLERRRETEERLADGAVAAGLLETMGSPFVNHQTEEAAFSAWLSAAGSASKSLSLANPLDESRRDLRATLLPGLLDALARNVHHEEESVALFEIGRAFDRAGNPEDPPSFESRRFAFALAGEARAHWSYAADCRQTDFFDAKGLVERLLLPWIDPEALHWTPFSAEAFALGAAALVSRDGATTLGVVGLVSEAERKKRHLTEPVFAGEILIDVIPDREGARRFRPYSLFPSIEVDLSLSHPRETTWLEIERFIREQGLAHIESLRLLDRYEAEPNAASTVKTTVRITFRSMERTLAQEEVNRERDRLAQALRDRMGVSF